MGLEVVIVDLEEGADESGESTISGVVRSPFAKANLQLNVLPVVVDEHGPCSNNVGMCMEAITGDYWVMWVKCIIEDMTSTKGMEGHKICQIRRF